jgi:hypothetical protein
MTQASEHSLAARGNTTPAGQTASVRLVASEKKGGGLI